MTYDVDAIVKAYPDAVTVDGDKGAFDSSGNRITLEQSKIDTARTELNAEYNAKKYRFTRMADYKEIGDQLDMLYHDLVSGKLDSTGTWAVHIKEVKDANPKP